MYGSVWERVSLLQRHETCANHVLTPGVRWKCAPLEIWSFRFVSTFVVVVVYRVGGVCFFVLRIVYLFVLRLTMYYPCGIFGLYECEILWSYKYLLIRGSAVQVFTYYILNKSFPPPPLLFPPSSSSSSFLFFFDFFFSCWPFQTRLGWFLFHLHCAKQYLLAPKSGSPPGHRRDSHNQRRSWKINQLQFLSNDA